MKHTQNCTFNSNKFAKEKPEIKQSVVQNQQKAG
jgi:hypothetical protein